MNKNKFVITLHMGWNIYDYYDTTVNEIDSFKGKKFN